MRFHLLFYVLLFTFYALLSSLILIINVKAQTPPKDQIAFYSNRDGNDEIYVMDADGMNLRRLTNHPASDTEPAWSPDGQKIAFRSNRDGNDEIYVMDADGKNPKNLTNHPASDIDPAWSPDGQKIVFASFRDGSSEIYVMDADGKKPKNLTNHPGFDRKPSWSPDGQKIAFASSWTGNWEVYVMDVDGTNLKHLTDHPASAQFDGRPVWSPDGQKIAFISLRDGNYEIYVMDADGTNPKNLTNHPANDGWDLAWSPDGQKIAFRSNRDGNDEIYVMDANGKNPKKLTNHPAVDGKPSWFDPDVIQRLIVVIIRNVFPGFGEPKGGTPVKIQGGNFIPGSQVFFGGLEASNVRVESSSLITAVTPPGAAGLVNVEVVRPDGKSRVLKDGFQYTTLKIIKITPENGPITGGITVQIEGFGFQPGTSVQIGDKSLVDVDAFGAPFLIRGTLPAGKPGAVDVVVINEASGGRDVLRNAFTYASPPAIKEVSPTFVPVVGFIKEITIKGVGFIRTLTVEIGVVAQTVDFVSSNELRIPRPASLAVGPQDLVVTNPDGQRAALPSGVTVLAPIKIKSVEPASGGLEGGTKITIVGEPTVEVAGRSYPSRFVKGVEVIIGGVKADEVTVKSDNIITAITPPNTPGPKDVDVVNVDGQEDFLRGGFIYNPLPQIIKVIPNNGPLSGGTKITIQGSKFLPGAKVLIGDVDANSYIVAPSSEVESNAFITAITPKVPLDEPGPRDVIVVNPDGQEVVLRDGYRYNPLPTIRSISPSYGPSSGGTKLIIRGTGFLQGARVIIGKRPATTEFKDDETIEAVTPANPKGRLDVRVVNPDTQEAIIPRAFISVVELAYNYPNPFRASQGTTFRYVPGPNETVESIEVRIFNLAGVPIGVVGQEGSNEVRWQDSRVNVGLYVYMMEVRVGGKVKQFKRALEVYK